ncbi:MAG: hypothetical protein ABIQ40_16145 [Bacteroidia bacterium]
MKSENIKSSQIDIYDNLPREVKDAITEGLAQADRGQTMTNKEFKEKFKKWFSRN